MKNFLIYRSSAGSGKTYTLVKEYLKIALNNTADYRHTLAVTFTNKAAEEMKSRIISGLVTLSEGKNPLLEKTLKDEGVKGDIKTNSRTVLSSILHDYSNFSVSTIDSFFQMVIRSFAKELKLHLGYRVELETAAVLDKVVDEVFSGIGEDEKLTKYLENFTFQNIDDDKGWHVERNIKDLAGEIFKERYWQKKREAENDILDNRDNIQGYINLLYAIKNDFEKKLIAAACEALELIKRSGLEIDDFVNKAKGVAGYFRKMSLKETYSDITKIEPYAVCLKIINENAAWYSQTSKKKAQIDKAVNDGLGRLLEDMLTYHEMNRKKYITVRVLIKTIYTIGIFSDITEKVKNYRDENHVLLISDANNLLKEVINGDSSPFIYEKIGTYYKNFLLDEFQDTSTFQWQNLLPLILNSLGEQNFSMVVGDVKQSIYRWRNGNMMLLLRDIESDLSGFKESIEARNLDTNYRSRSNIIEFNNRLFESASENMASGAETGDADIIRQAYRETKQGSKPGSEGGYVKIEFIPYDKESEFKPAQLAGKKTIETVTRLTEEGIQQGDILILVRNNNEIRTIAMLLSLAGFKAVSDESLLLINSPKVKLILSMFSYITDRKNKLAKAELLYNYLKFVKGSSEEDDLIFRDHLFLDKIFNTEMPDELFSNKQDGKINLSLSRKNLYELTETLVSIFGLNLNPDLYLTRFLDVVHEYTSVYNNNIAGFLDWWDENSSKYSIVIPSQSDAIRVMTIHKAKGLESPVVIVPFANWDTEISGSRDLIWVSSDEKPFNASSSFLVKASSDLKESYFSDDYANEYILTKLDNLNLMYVAFTRAEERLYVISPQKGNNSKNINRLLNDLFFSDERLAQLKKSGNIFEFGAPGEIKKTGHAQGMQNIIPVQIVSTGENKKAVIKPLHGNIRFDKAESYNESVNKGLLLHKALSYIKTADDIHSAVEMLKLHGLITENFAKDIEAELVKIVNDKRITEWFKKDSEIRTEAEILAKEGIFRPDRIVMDGNDLTLIDYKTGKENKKHSEQMKKYSAVLNEAGYRITGAYLLYLDNLNIVKVL